MKIFSRDNPSRPLIMVCTTYAIVCYALFFIAWLLPTPEWAPTLMAWFAKTIKAIAVSTRVGELNGYDPFPIQVVILYCAVGITPITVYCIQFCLFNQSNRRKWFDGFLDKAKEKKISRQKLLFMGVVTLSAAIWVPYLTFFYEWNNLEWRTIKGYSPTIFATLLFLIGSFIPTLGSLAGGGGIYLVFSKHLKKS